MSVMAVVGTIAKIEIDGRTCFIDLPPGVFERLDAGERWRGGVVIRPVAPSLFARTVAIKAQVQQPMTRQVVRATVDERRVVRAWNRSHYIKTQEAKSVNERDSRNYTVAFKDIAAVLPMVRKAIKNVGIVELIRGIETYFDFCATGAHIWEGKSHGFKSLQGFLEKLLLLHRTKQKPWWDVRDMPARTVVDAQPKLTVRLADSFAQTFMDEQKFTIEQGSKEHVNLARAAAQITSYIDRKKRQNIILTETVIIQNLLEFVSELFADHNEPVYTSHLASSSIWSAFPQYLLEKGVI